MKTRFVITKIDKDGLRVLAVANQGRNHFDTEETAQTHLRAILSNNSESTLKSVFGDTAKMKVISAPCYDHGDCMHTVFGIDGKKEKTKHSTPYQPKTGSRCHCRPGQQRDNCPACEGTGWRVDFAAIRTRNVTFNPSRMEYDKQD